MQHILEKNTLEEVGRGFLEVILMAVDLMQVPPKQSSLFLLARLATPVDINEVARLHILSVNKRAILAVEVDTRLIHPVVTLLVVILVQIAIRARVVPMLALVVLGLVLE